MSYLDMAVQVMWS